MFDRDLPQPGESWVHFKNKEKSYYIIGDAYQLLNKEKPFGIIYTESWVNVVKELANINEYFAVKHTENGSLYEVYLEENKWCLSVILKKYLKTIYIPPVVGWVRPIENFMEILSNPSNQEFSNYYRFTKIK